MPLPIPIPCPHWLIISFRENSKFFAMVHSARRDLAPLALQPQVFILTPFLAVSPPHIFGKIQAGSVLQAPVWLLRLCGTPSHTRPPGTQVLTQMPLLPCGQPWSPCFIMPSTRRYTLIITWIFYCLHLRDITLQLTMNSSIYLSWFVLSFHQFECECKFGYLHWCEHTFRIASEPD